MPFALAFYAGLRRSDMSRPWEDIGLQWRHVDLEALELTVPKSKSRAGTGRHVPIAAPLRPILRRAWLRQGSPGQEGRVLGAVSLHSGKLGTRVRKAWETESEKRLQEGEPGLEPIGLHECRHTYASFLMAAHYTLRELMEYMGHSSLQATERYVKLLPQPGERNAADRLNAYLASTR